MPGGAAPPQPSSSLEIFDMKFYDTLWFCFCCCFLLFVILFLVCSCLWFAIACYIVCYVVRAHVCDIILLPHGFSHDVVSGCCLLFYVVCL